MPLLQLDSDLRCEGEHGPSSRHIVIWSLCVSASLLQLVSSQPHQVATARKAQPELFSQDLGATAEAVGYWEG